MFTTLHEDDLQAWYRLAKIEPVGAGSVPDFEFDEEEFTLELLAA